MNNYSFCKFKIPTVGGRVIWEITNECNYACSYCIFSSTGRKPAGELSTQQVFNTIEQLKQAGFSYIKITGGEPFLREDMLSILSYAKSLGFELDISTNASKITPEIAEQLALLNMNYIHVSIDGYNQETHESVRGKKSFEPTMSGLRLLKEYGNTIRIGTVLHLHNQDYIPEMVEYFNTFKVDSITFSIMEPVGRLKDKNKLLITSSIDDLSKTINQCVSSANITNNLASFKKITFDNPKIKNTNLACPGGDKFLFINSIGIVSPCPWISESKPDYHFLSLHEQSLDSILQSPLFSQFRWIANTMAKDLEGCPVEIIEQFNLIESSIKENEFLEHGKFGNQHPVYSFTTENLEYISNFSVNNKKVLTITGSGDHAIVLALHGAKHIVSIDINAHSNLYAELKIIALQNLNFQQFKEFFLLGNNSFNYSIYLSFKVKLPKKSQYFWDYLYHQFNYDGAGLRNSDFFNLRHDINEEKIHNCFYLQNENLYHQAVASLINVKIEYLQQHILEHKNLPYSFDLILLSNIADYSHQIFPNENHVAQFRDNIVSPLLEHIHLDGEIMFSYVFDALNILGSDKRNHFNCKEVRNNHYQLLGKYREIYFDSSIKNALNDCICIIKRNVNE